MLLRDPALPPQTGAVGVRKPAGVSFETWVEKQVREARERGAFENLPGAGKPIPPGSYSQDEWIRSKARRENLPIAAMLPPGLVLCKEVEDLPALLARERSEAKARQLLVDLDARILAWHRGPTVGPAVFVRRLDIEAELAAWRAARPAPQAPVSDPAPPAPARRRGLLRRRPAG